LVGNRDYWAKHFGSEAVELIVSHAFLKVNLHRFNAGMWSSNLAARSCFEKKRVFGLKVHVLKTIITELGM